MILLAAGHLLARRFPLRLVALALIASAVWSKNPLRFHDGDEEAKGGIALWARNPLEFPSRAEEAKGMWPGEKDLVAWLDAHEQPPLAVSSRCRELALWSRARLHWIRCDSSPDETLGPRWPPKSGQSWPPENRPVVRVCPGR